MQGKVSDLAAALGSGSRAMRSVSRSPGVWLTYPHLGCPPGSASFTQRQLPCGAALALSSSCCLCALPS